MELKALDYAVARVEGSRVKARSCRNKDRQGLNAVRTIEKPFERICQLV